MHKSVKNVDYFFHEKISDYNLLNHHIEAKENIHRILAINICIYNDKRYDNSNIYQKYYYSSIPWKNKRFYKETTPYLNYNQSNFPEYLNIRNDNQFKGIQFKALSYSPFVFHHIRLFRKQTIDNILKSLDPHKNLAMINESKVTGGRGDNTIFHTWDKKLIIKTINESETDLFINEMLEEYHMRMRDSKSTLSQIFGVFKIEIGDKGQSYLLLQRNMNDVFLDSNLLTFDIKGSTADRQTIKKADINLDLNQLMNKYKKSTLKDIDLNITKMNIELNPYDGQSLLVNICKDSMFLQKYKVTDYSLLIFINI